MKCPLLQKPVLVTVILVLSFLALSLKIFYYVVMHVWNNVILTGKKLTRKEFGGNGGGSSNVEGGATRNIHSGFFRYVFISR